MNPVPLTQQSEHKASYRSYTHSGALDTLSFQTTSGTAASVGVHYYFGK